MVICGFSNRCVCVCVSLGSCCVEQNMDAFKGNPFMPAINLSGQSD